MSRSFAVASGPLAFGAIVNSVDSLLLEISLLEWRSYIK
jgi:hypothetical protein